MTGVQTCALPIFFIQGDEGIAQLFGLQEGARVFHLDTLVATDEVLPKASTRMGEVLTLDTHVRPQIAWVTIGGVVLAKSEGKPLMGAGVEAKYRQSQGKLGALVKAFAPGILKGAKQIAFDIASQNALSLIVQVEEKSGGKYNAVVQVKGGAERSEVVLNLADFKPAQDSKDNNDHLDTDQIFQVVLIDLTGATEAVDRENTLWINHLRALFGK